MEMGKSKWNHPIQSHHSLQPSWWQQGGGQTSLGLLLAKHPILAPHLVSVSHVKRADAAGPQEGFRERWGSCVRVGLAVAGVQRRAEPAAGKRG